MDTDCTYLSYRQTNAFSSLVCDYTDNPELLQSFYSFRPDQTGLDQAIKARSRYPVNRRLLVDALKRQYTALPEQEAVLENINKLNGDNTFTVCTAHQPNLLTGYLYFIYKIIHAIKLSEELNGQYPDKHFVPVYYMGSEDNDLEELGRFRFRGKSYTWDAAGQTGAVGRMNTRSLKPLLEELFRSFGPPGPHCSRLEEMIRDAYGKHNSIGRATQYLVHQLFGQYGLIVLDPDDPALKSAFTEIMTDDLLEHSALPLVQRQSALLEQHYKAQAYPRPINLFYLKDDIRERIESDGTTWTVLHTGIRWTREALLEELQQHPERFSPNVILRGLFQESILPDVAFIGGGAEVAYWMQLKPVFDHYKVFFPLVLLRQSVQWISPAAALKMQQLGLDTEQVFSGEAGLQRLLVDRNSDKDRSIAAEQRQVETLIRQLQQKAVAIDPTLNYSAEAVWKKISYQLEVLEAKMYRQEKRKFAIETERLRLLKRELFPGGSLQERSDNFMAYYLEHGPAFFQLLKDAIRPLDNRFLVLSEKALP